MLIRLFFCLALSLLLPTAALAESLNYGKNGLQVQNPVGFVDSASISEELFNATRDKSGLNGVLLKVYLPDNIAQYYGEGRTDAVTRQVCLYGLAESEKWSFDRKALELLSKSLEASFGKYQLVPDEQRRNRASLESFLSEALSQGESLLISTVHSDNSDIYLSLLSYPIGEAHYLSQAMSTALVLVGENIVFINASSIIQDGEPYEHMLWTRNAAESFADMLASANKN